MAKYQHIINNHNRLRSMTGLTPEEFADLAGHFGHMFETYMATHTMDGYIREYRRYTPYRNSPLPTDEDKLLFILSFLRQNVIQEVHGQIFSMSQSNVSKWAHILHEVLNRTLAAQQLLPARTAAAMGVEMAASDGLPSTDSPLFITTGLNDRSIAR